MSAKIEVREGPLEKQMTNENQQIPPDDGKRFQVLDVLVVVFEDEIEDGEGGPGGEPL